MKVDAGKNNMKKAKKTGVCVDFGVFYGRFRVLLFV